MSHYTVLVMVDGAKSVSEIQDAVSAQLAPFIEQYDPDVDHVFEWVDETDEYMGKFMNETSTMCEMPDGEVVNAKWAGSCYEPVDGGVLIEVPHNERYPSFEAFVADYCGYTEIPGKPGRYGYRHNPNAKWDWWVTGGRWEGLLKKDMGPGKPPEDVDMLRRRELFVDEADARDKATLFYERATPIIRGGAQDEDGKRLVLGWGDSLTAANTGLRDIEAEQNHIKENGRENWRYVPADPYPTLEEFVETRYSRWLCFQTYAVLDLEGVWHSPGEMGWFGMSTDSPDDNMKFRNGFFEKYLKNLCPDTWLVVVDCHI